MIHDIGRDSSCRAVPMCWFAAFPMWSPCSLDMGNEFFSPNFLCRLECFELLARYYSIRFGSIWLLCFHADRIEERGLPVALSRTQASANRMDSAFREERQELPDLFRQVEDRVSKVIVKRGTLSEHSMPIASVEDSAEGSVQVEEDDPIQSRVRDKNWFNRPPAPEVFVPLNEEDPGAPSPSPAAPTTPSPVVETTTNQITTTKRRRPANRPTRTPRPPKVPETTKPGRGPRPMVHPGYNYQRPTRPGLPSDFRPSVLVSSISNGGFRPINRPAGNANNLGSTSARPTWQSKPIDKKMKFPTTAQESSSPDFSHTNYSSHLPTEMLNGTPTANTSRNAKGVRYTIRIHYVLNPVK